MTISTESRRSATFVGDGVTTVFPFAFKVFALSEVVGVKSHPMFGDVTLTQPGDFTTFLNTDQDVSPGGTITLPGVLPVGYTLVLKSQVDYEQSLKLNNAGAFYPESLNDALDKLVIQIQQVLDITNNLDDSVAFQTLADAAYLAIDSFNPFSVSTTSLAIGTGSKTLTVEPNKSFKVGMTVKIASSADGTKWMLGDVTSYNTSTGQLIVSVSAVKNSGTLASWVISLASPVQDFIAPQAEYDRIFTATDSGSTSTALHFTYTSTITSLYDGQLFLIKSPVTLSGSATYQVDAIAAKALVLEDGTASAGNDIISGQYYIIRYASALDKFILHNPSRFNKIQFNRSGGSAAAPAITFDGNTDTGMFFDGSGYLGLTSLGAEVANFQSGFFRFGVTSNVTNETGIWGSGNYSGDNYARINMMCNTSSVGDKAAFVWYDATGSGQIGALYYHTGSNKIILHNADVNAPSDYRKKENVVPLNNGLDIIMQLNPVTFTWKSDGSAGGGLIAHELQALMPELVRGEKDGVDENGEPAYQSVNYTGLIHLLIGAVQEQQEEIRLLNERLTNHGL